MKQVLTIVVRFLWTHELVAKVRRIQLLVVVHWCWRLPVVDLIAVSGNVGVLLLLVVHQLIQIHHERLGLLIRPCTLLREVVRDELRLHRVPRRWT